MIPFVLIFWDTNALKAIAAYNVIESLALLTMFMKLFCLMKRLHAYEFNRHKNQLIIFFIITFFMCIAKCVFVIMGSINPHNRLNSNAKQQYIFCNNSEISGIIFSWSYFFFNEINCLEIIIAFSLLYIKSTEDVL